MKNYSLSFLTNFSKNISHIMYNHAWPQNIEILPQCSAINEKSLYIHVLLDLYNSP